MVKQNRRVESARQTRRIEVEAGAMHVTVPPHDRVPNTTVSKRSTKKSKLHLAELVHNHKQADKTQPLEAHLAFSPLRRLFARPLAWHSLSAFSHELAAPRAAPPLRSQQIF